MNRLTNRPRLSALLLACAVGSATLFAPAVAQAASPLSSPLAAPVAATSPLSSPLAAPRAAALLKPGQRGAAVVALQKRLISLGYWLDGATGYYGHTTSQAVMALQKVAGIGRDGVAGPATQAALAKGLRPKARSRGTLVEVDKRRQIIMVVKNGAVQKILNTSTGNNKSYCEKGRCGVAVTPSGTYSVYRQVKGWDYGPLGGLYAPKYFKGGYAIHGSLSIPGYPASHGCARVSVAAMNMLWATGALPIGGKVSLY